MKSIRPSPDRPRLFKLLSSGVVHARGHRGACAAFTNGGSQEPLARASEPVAEAKEFARASAASEAQGCRRHAAFAAPSGARPLRRSTPRSLYAADATA